MPATPKTKARLPKSPRETPRTHLCPGTLVNRLLDYVVFVCVVVAVGLAALAYADELRCHDQLLPEAFGRCPHHDHRIEYDDGRFICRCKDTP